MTDRWVTLAVVVYVANVLFWVFVLCMQGCYLEHEAETCAADGGESYEPEAQMAVHSPAKREDAGSKPAGFSQCAGPIVAGECYRNVHDWVSQHGEK